MAAGLALLLFHRPVAQALSLACAWWFFLAATPPRLRRWGLLAMLLAGFLPFLPSASGLEEISDALAQSRIPPATARLGAAGDAPTVSGASLFHGNAFRASVLLYHTASFSPVYALSCCFADPWLGEFMYPDSPRHYSFEPAAALGPGILCLAGGLIATLGKLSRAGAR